MAKASRNRKRNRRDPNSEECVGRTVFDFFSNNGSSILLVFLSLVFATLICGSMCGISGLIGWNGDVLHSWLQMQTPDPTNMKLDAEIKLVVDVTEELSERIDVLHEQLSIRNDDEFLGKLNDLVKNVEVRSLPLTKSTCECITREEFSKVLKEFTFNKREEELGFNEGNDTKASHEILGILQDS